MSWKRGSGDSRGKWESEREKERKRECVVKCCFCLQNDLKEPKKCKKSMYCLSKSLVYGIYRDYQRNRTYALREIILIEVRVGGSPPIKGILAGALREPAEYDLLFVPWAVAYCARFSILHMVSSNTRA